MKKLFNFYLDRIQKDVINKEKSAVIVIDVLQMVLAILFRVLFALAQFFIKNRKLIAVQTAAGIISGVVTGVILYFLFYISPP